MPVETSARSLLISKATQTRFRFPLDYFLEDMTMYRKSKLLIFSVAVTLTLRNIANGWGEGLETVRAEGPKTPALSL